MGTVLHFRTTRGHKEDEEIANSESTSGRNREPRSQNVESIRRQSVRRWLIFLGLRYSCPCVEKLLTVLRVP
jgi:hypothetical protein